MSNLELDPIEIISFPIFLPNQYILMTFDQVFKLLQVNPIACIKMRQIDIADINSQPLTVDGLPTLRPLSAGNLIGLAIENGKPKTSFSLVGCLDRLAIKRGRELKFEVKPLPVQTMFGAMDALIIGLKPA
jgi:hypothetical protein